MKPANACRQCREAKRKCSKPTGDLHTPCLPCQQRQLLCSNSVKRSESVTVAPAVIAPSLLSSDDAFRFVRLYMHFIHDRPHSLFHERTLWADVRANNVPECLLMAICAVGCRFSSNTDHHNLRIVLKTRSSTSFCGQLETISLSNVQTCILLANLYAAEQNNALEALYFGIANRMAHVLRLHEPHIEDDPIVREVKCRVWWTLFMADRWCPPGLSLPREIRISDTLVELPTDEIEFQSMSAESQHQMQSRKPGLWQYMITLADILGPIQDLNQSLVGDWSNRDQIDQLVSNLAERLQAWFDTLPDQMVMNDNNLNRYRDQHHGGTFVALHLGYHHYSVLLYFQYLDVSSEQTPKTTLYANRCRFHASRFSQLLSRARERGDCHVVYLTVAHMTMVSSSVLLHMLLFGGDDEVEIARMQLTSNFEALIELKAYWPVIDTITRRLLMFQNMCLRSATQTHRVDKWMIRFLLEHALPLEDRELNSDGLIPVNSLSPSILHTGVSSERTKMLNDAFTDLCA